MAPLRVVICGGGFAAIECLLRLRRLAGDRVAITLLCPNEYLSYRPLTVLVPFGQTRVARYPIRELAEAAGAQWIRNRAEAIEHRDHIVHTADGDRLGYDALVLAVGGKERKANRHVTLFSDRSGGQTYHGIIEAIDAGTITKLALLDPRGPSWPLPLYELALLTAKHARDRGLDLDINLVTSYPHPLYPFGDEVGAAVRQLLERAGIVLYLQSSHHFGPENSIRLEPAGVDLQPDRIVTVPVITGPNLPGVPGDARDRFVPIDPHCRVLGTDGYVFAAGDATELTVKHGGLAAQQADTVAAGIAHLVDAVPAPEPFRPVLRGTLLTGGVPLYLEANLVAGTSWRAKLLTEPTWPADQLVVAEELAGYLAEHPSQQAPRD